MTNILTALGLSAGAAFTAMNLLVPSPELNAPRAEVLVETWAGHIYVAGVGSDCETAWHRAVIRHDWRSISCTER